MKIILLLAFLTLRAFAQDCQQSSELTTSGSSGPIIDNRNRGCQLWNLAYWVEGFSALTIRLEYSIDQQNWTATSLSKTDTPVGLGNVRLYAPYFRINLTSATGSGKVKFVVGGYKGSYGLTDIIAGGSGGGGTGTELTSVTTSGGDEFLGVSSGDSRVIQWTLCTISSLTSQILCPGGYRSQGTNAGLLQLAEAGASGSDYVGWQTQDSSDTYVLKPPAVAPATGQVMLQGAPSGSPSASVATWGDVLKTGGTNANGYFDWTLGAAPGNPASGDIRLYPKTGNTLCARDSAGTETCYGSGSGGGGVQRVAYASVPGTCDSSNANTLYITEILKGHCNGSSYQWYDGDDTVTLPGVLSGWTQVNSPSTATDTVGTIFLRAAAASGHSVKSILKSISGTDWTITGKWRNQMAGQANGICGLVFSAGNTSSDRVYIFGENTADGSTNGNTYVLVWDFSNYTTSTANNILSGTAYPTRAPGSTFYRVVKSGTNWSYQISRDNGQNYITLRTIAQPFTAAYAGFACSSGGDGANDGDAAITISHYLNQ